MFDRIKKLRFALTALIFVAVAAALLNHSATKPVQATGEMVSVIVELKDDPGAVYKARTEKAGGSVSTTAMQSYRDSLRVKQDQFLAALSSRGLSGAVMTRDIKNLDGSLAATIPLRYTLVYNGLAMKVSPSAIPAIKGMSQVKNVHKNEILQTTLHNSVKYIRAPQLYGKFPELTQFDDLREGYEGQGMHIAIIDTGVDWTHAMFGGDPTPPRLGVAPPTPAATSTNKKVVYYLPLTDSAAYDGFGHGTHVASTAAGYLAQAPGPDRLPNTADDIRIHGVAPQAKLMSYKVCSDAGSTGATVGVSVLGGCQSADIITAIEDAVSPFTLTGQAKPVANVINMSLGGGGGPDTATAVAASNAALTGTVVVAASGNSGPGEGTTGSPAAGTHVISIGATTHPGSASMWSVDMPGYNRIALQPMGGAPLPPASSINQKYVFVDTPLVPWPASVSGRIALVREPFGATFFDYSAQAAAAGAVAFIMIRDEGAYAIKSIIPAACISTADAEIMLDAISSTDNNSVDPATGTVSEQNVQLNRFLSDTFTGDMAGFSSRGPVVGLGQVKPDVSAPGVTVLAAVSPGSVLGTLATVDYAPDPNHLMSTDSTNAPNYTAIDGTSMATPHMAGAAALIKQAHPDWTPDVIRTAFINTATNMRNLAGTPKSDGLTADSIIAQGGGLVDLKEAVNAKALMGVTGDGIIKPGILGSHSYGEVPVINSRVTNTSPITVTVRDLSGEGGTYNLAVANNRDLQLAGINVALSQSSVSLAPGGEATFTVNATVDGDLLRDVMAAKTNGTQIVFEKIQMQWFVTAQRSDGGESLRMPFFFRPGRSIPAQPIVSTTTNTDIMPAGDSGAQRDLAGEWLAEGVTFKTIPFTVDTSTYQIDAKTEWMQVGETGHPDIDYQLLDPDGKVIAESGNGVGPEFVSIRVARAGTYTHRVIGFTSVATEFTVTTTLRKGNTPPVLQSIAADFNNAQGTPVDFDGSVNLSWQATSGATAYEIERANGGDYEVVASAGGNQTSITLANQPSGELSYRVKALAPGQIGSYETAPSNSRNVIVDPRNKVDITSQIATAMSNVSFTGGVFKLDLNIANNSTSAYVPLVELKVVGITSASGMVSVKNADNGGNGRSLNTAALFGYSSLLGADEQFTPAEITGNRSLQFNDAASELFSFDVVVTAFQRTSSGGEQGGVSQAQSPGAGGASGGAAGSPLAILKVMRITVNPLTKAVSAKLL
jgi:subtilisin family serine protease